MTGDTLPVQLNGNRSQPMGGVVPPTAISPAIPIESQNKITNDIPPRFQWNHHGGYCGEVSLISAGLYYGQYVSQYTARCAGSGITTNSQCICCSDQSNQVLLGANNMSKAAVAAGNMHLNYVVFPTEYNSQGTRDLLSWVKAYVLNGYPVAIGLYENQYLFYGDTNRHAGDPEYDHIVPVYGIESSDSAPPPLPPPFLTYVGTDKIYFSDNGLWGPVNDPVNPPNLPNPADPYTFSSTFDNFQATREEANSPDGMQYSLAKSSASVGTYGIAITGIVDLDGFTIPIRVKTNVNYEFPQIDKHSNSQPSSMPITLTVIVGNSLKPLNPLLNYNVYQYNQLSNVPNSMFNANAGNASHTFPIPSGTGPTYTFTVNIDSSDVAVFRAVPTTAP